MLVLLLSSLFLGTALSVAAVSDNEEINDITGDVVDLVTTEIVSTSPYVEIDSVDITQVRYTRDNTQVTLTLIVNGNIEDRGKLSDFNWGDDMPEQLNIDAVGYSFSLITDNESYTILYVNQECQLLYSYYSDIPVNLTSSDFQVRDNTLTINFDLLTDEELIEEVSVEASYIRMQIDINNPPDNWEEFITSYIDYAPNPPLEVYAEIADLGTTTGDAYLGTVGSELQFNGSAINGQPPYIYLWDFGDGQTSGLQNPTHIYEQEGTYSFNLTVTDNTGSQEIFGGSIVVNAETPNGNGGSTGTNMLLVIGIILVIVAVGVVIIIYIIRR